MARLDVRVAAELPAKAEYRLKSRIVSISVVVKNLSLGGALVQGLKSRSGPVTLRAILPGGEIALSGSTLRRGRNGSAVRFSTPDLPVLSDLWKYIRERVFAGRNCPYCLRKPSGAAQSCPGCRGYLEFGDPDYLEAHLKNTIAERIRSRYASLDLPKLQRILRILEEESPAEPQTPRPPEDAPQALALLLRTVVPGHGNVLISRLLDLLNAATDHLPPVPETTETPSLQGETYRDLLARAGKDAVCKVLERNGFNIARSAREMQISRPGLYWLMKRYDIRKPG